jgi:hypothetical protein
MFRSFCHLAFSRCFRLTCLVNSNIYCFISGWSFKIMVIQDNIVMSACSCHHISTCCCLHSLFVSLSIYVMMCLALFSVCVCVCVCLSVSLSVCLSVSLSLYLYFSHSLSHSLTHTLTHTYTHTIAAKGLEDFVTCTSQGVQD